MLFFSFTQKNLRKSPNSTYNMISRYNKVEIFLEQREVAFFILKLFILYSLVSNKRVDLNKRVFLLHLPVQRGFFFWKTINGYIHSLETYRAGAAYVVKPARPRSYLDFEKQNAAAAVAACRHYRGLTWPGRAHRAGGAPAVYVTLGFAENGQSTNKTGIEN